MSGTSSTNNLQPQLSASMAAGAGTAGLTAGAAALVSTLGLEVGLTVSAAGPVGAVVGALTGLGFLFADLFGGGPDIPRELRLPAHSPEGLMRAGVTDLVNQNNMACHGECHACHSESMTVTAYDNGFASTGKTPGDPGYGVTASGWPAGIGTIAAPSRFKFGTKMYIPGYGCGRVRDRGGSAIQGSHIDVWLPPPLSNEWGVRENVEVEVCDDP